MIASSEKFSRALRYSHESITRVTCDGVELPLENGRLNLSRSANVRRTGSLDLRDDGTGVLQSLSTASMLTIERGIRFLDGSTEYVTVGVLRVEEMDVDQHWTTARVSLADLGQAVDDLPILAAWQPLDEAGNPLTVVDAIKVLVDQSLVDSPTWTVDPNLDTTQLTVAGQVFKADTGRWSAITELAAQIGAAVFVGSDGTWRIARAAHDATPVLRVASGDEGALIERSSKVTRRGSYNAVVVEWGTTSTTGGTVVLVDADPDSPTYWNGPWGRRPRSSQRLAVATEAEAITAAEALLAVSVGLPVAIDFRALYDSRLEPNDVIAVSDPSGTDLLVVLDDLTLPLIDATMSGAGRQVNS